MAVALNQEPAVPPVVRHTDGVFAPDDDLLAQPPNGGASAAAASAAASAGSTAAKSAYPLLAPTEDGPRGIRFDFAGGANPAAVIHIPGSAGELIDKITILAIKQKRITEPVKLANVRHELVLLQKLKAQRVPGGAELAVFESELRSVNGSLWDIEDALRAHEARLDFGTAFIVPEEPKQIVGLDLTPPYKGASVTTPALTFENAFHANNSASGGQPGGARPAVPRVECRLTGGNHA